MALRTSFPTNQACTGCGGSCQGVRVQLLDDEIEPVRGHAVRLGIADPVEHGRLRFADGRCVFLEGPRCALHARVGAAAKPAVCRQFPLVAVETEAGRRVGIDPGCYTAWSTRAAAPLPADTPLTSRVMLEPAAVRQEAGLLALLDAPGRERTFRLALLLAAALQIWTAIAVLGARYAFGA